MSDHSDGEGSVRDAHSGDEKWGGEGKRVSPRSDQSEDEKQRNSEEERDHSEDEGRVHKSGGWSQRFIVYVNSKNTKKYLLMEIMTRWMSSRTFLFIFILCCS